MSAPTRSASPTCACPACGVRPDGVVDKPRKPRFELGGLFMHKHRLRWYSHCCGYTWATPTADAEGESGE